jgi:hypothetical protein
VATRFYLGSSTAADISPSFGNGGIVWLITSSADRKKLLRSKDLSVMTSKTAATNTASTTYILNRQYVSEPLAAQTILASTLVSIALRGNISSTASGTVGSFAVGIRVVDSSGIDRSLAFYKDGTAYSTTLANKSYSSQTLNASNWTINSGDRLIVEIGWAYTAGTNTTRSVTQSFGSDSATDLPSDNTTTATNNPWIEFSQTLLFQGALLPFSYGYVIQ